MTGDTQHLFVASIISIKMTGHFLTKIKMKTLTVMISLSSRVSCSEEDCTVGLTLIGVLSVELNKVQSVCKICKLEREERQILVCIRNISSVARTVCVGWLGRLLLSF